MNQQAIVAGVVIFILIVGGMFTYTYLKKQELEQIQPENEASATETELTLDNLGIDRIDGVHYFIDGTHTVVGELVMPTPCDLLEVDAVVAESMPEQINLQFSVLNTALSCAQMLTPQRYSVSVDASEDATLSATWHGTAVPLNLIPAPPGATPDEFEVFLKG